MKKKITLLVLLVTTLSLGLVLASFRQPQADADAETASYEATSFDLPEEAEYITDLKAMQDGTICAVAGSSQAQDVICYTCLLYTSHRSRRGAGGKTRKQSCFF